MQDKSLNTREFEELFEGILKLKNTKECKQFFRDLCTIAELRAMAERFQIAKKVSSQEPYRKISKRTGSSTATITRVAQWLHHGMGGYGLVLKRLGH